MTAESGNALARRRKLFSLADHLGFTRDERIELAKLILWRDITSYANLDDEQVSRLLDCFEGYIAIAHTIMNRTAAAVDR